jgi:hypothetical protein
MRAANLHSKMAWGEREANDRSAKWSAAMVVATLAALLVFCNSPLHAVKQTAEFQRARETRLAQRRAAEEKTLEILRQDWKRWTAEDCELVLNYSNWAIPSGMAGTLSGGLVVQLRSALPVREALLRQLQLKKHYDTMAPQGKLAFDKKNPPKMAESENDPILLYVEHDVSYSGRHGNAESVDSSQQAALELADGTLVMPIKTESLGWVDAIKILYSFPRAINGKPVLTRDDQKLNFVFGAKLAAGGRILPLQDPTKFQINNAKLVDMRLLQRVWFLPAGLTYDSKLEY